MQSFDARGPHKVCPPIFMFVMNYCVAVLRDAITLLGGAVDPWTVIEVAKVVAVVIIVTMRKGTASVLLNAVANDSMFSSADVLIEAAFERKVKYLHEHGFARRYAYYAIACMTSHVTNVLTWWAFDGIIYWSVIATTCPMILNQVLDTEVFERAYGAATRQVCAACKYVFYSFAAWLLNNVCEGGLGIRPQFSRTEVEFAHCDRSSDLVAFVKAIVIAILMNHFERSPRPYMWALVALYRYGFITEPVKDDPDIATIGTDRDRLIVIVLGRRWDQLYNPSVIRSIMYLYSSSSSNALADAVRDALSTADNAMIKFFAVYTIASIFSIAQLVVPITWFIYLLERAHTSADAPLAVTSASGVAAKLVATLLCAWSQPPGACALAAISELGGLADNRATRWMCRRSYDYWRDHEWKLRQVNDNLRELASYPTFMFVVGAYAGAGAVVIGMLAAEMVRAPGLMALYAILGYCSGYGPVHLASISVIYYVYQNLLNVPNLGRKPLEMSIIAGYVPEGGPANAAPKVIVYDDYLESKNNKFTGTADIANTAYTANTADIANISVSTARVIDDYGFEVVE